MQRILLVEQDRRTARFVSSGLAAEGYPVEVVDNGTDGIELARSGEYRLMILDRLLRDRDGIEVCDTLRRERNGCLILMLTAKATLEDKLRGLRAGADDYMTKPFAFDELLARIDCLLRRARHWHEGDGIGELRVGDLVLASATRRAQRGQRQIALTLKEYTLLAYLMHNAGRVLSRVQILNHVWGYSFDPGSKVVEVYVRYLQQKVDDGEAVKLIRTVRGFGYTVSME